MKLTIDHINIEVPEGTTVMDAASTLGINIPSMCFLKGVRREASCMVCLVKEENSGKYFPSCEMPVSEGMSVITNDEDVREMRKQSLELLLSDHVGDCEAPCRLSCPAFMNIPLMNRLIAQGKFDEALNLVRQEIALPFVLGYICPAPCEKACHRGSHDAPVSICLLKRSTAQFGQLITPPLLEERRLGGEVSPFQNNVAIIGSGPAGLSAAYYIQKAGYNCTIFDKNALPGGTLRYDIPEEVLPKEVLDEDIRNISLSGAQLKMNETISKERFQSELLRDFTVVILATGHRELHPTDFIFNDLENPSNTIDHKHFTTSNPRVFACGSVIQEQKMAVKAAAQGHLAAIQVIRYLESTLSTNEPSLRAFKFHSLIGRLSEPELDEYLKESIPDHRVSPSGGYLPGFTEAEAIHEAQRCLCCDCRKPLTCKLRIYSDEYGAERRRFAGPLRKALTKSIQHDFVVYEPQKCIKCGICIEISKKEKTALGMTYIGRGFDVVVAIPFNEDLKEALVLTAKECVEYCPTGALAFRQSEEVKNEE